ncbi:flavin-containing monooxygenase [Aspergillus clavatus NRRL 1]|uniref:Monooxygenase n=1 Tax=Aspergillus clavatus (strain ATCC 1007 / CBS 513.65 / DSM 816 / NCTC 3887 / NRRL 1 / QM 1276 / 107) TaxID=344612 RepID=A1C7M6_ASPCL|nr:monooxygenase [Aspergillus clavatus NRRL 1]EAW14397.1 monooxygenase [Aspergillus clavatus NRRL 1]
MCEESGQMGIRSQGMGRGGWGFLCISSTSQQILPKKKTPSASMSASASTPSPFVQVMIIGAGFSGLAMACQMKLKLKCKDFVIYDRASASGGTWWANQYPGCGVDIPAVFYSLSFAPNPGFSKVFPKQSEILQYFNKVATDHGIPPHMVFHTQWEGAEWKEDTSSWRVQLRNLATNQCFEQECKVLISAVGGLSVPKPFSMRGMETFKGEIMHTAEWKHDVVLDGKDVVVIGNGASAAQLIPAILKQCKSVTQFIRTPQHYMPSQNNTIHPLLRTAFRFIPILLWLIRTAVFLYLETTGPYFGLTEAGSALRKVAVEKSQRYIQANSPESYWSLLLPKFELGCKRRVFDNDEYIACLRKQNIYLTDEKIAALQPDSVLTKSGAVYPAQIIILATGFALRQFDIQLYGRDGLSREDHWKQLGSKSAFKTVAMAGFPNFFYVLGPHSGRGHTSTLFAVESFVGLIIRAMKPVINGHAQLVEINSHSERVFYERTMTALDQTVFQNNCGSWFIDQKSGLNWFSYPWSSFEMWFSTHIEGMNDWIYKVSLAVSELSRCISAN